MQISILSMCNFMGRPVEAGSVIDAVSPSEAAAAWYLVSIGKAKVFNPKAVIEVDAEESPSPAPNTSIAGLDTSKKSTRSTRPSAQREDDEE